MSIYDLEYIQPRISENYITVGMLCHVFVNMNILCELLTLLTFSAV